MAECLQNVNNNSSEFKYKKYGKKVSGGEDEKNVEDRIRTFMKLIQDYLEAHGPYIEVACGIVLLQAVLNYQLLLIIVLAASFLIKSRDSSENSKNNATSAKLADYPKTTSRSQCHNSTTFVPDRGRSCSPKMSQRIQQNCTQQNLETNRKELKQQQLNPKPVMKKQRNDCGNIAQRKSPPELQSTGSSNSQIDNSSDDSLHTVTDDIEKQVRKSLASLVKEIFGSQTRQMNCDSDLHLPYSSNSEANWFNTWINKELLKRDQKQEMAIEKISELEMKLDQFYYKDVMQQRQKTDSTSDATTLDFTTECFRTNNARTTDVTTTDLANMYKKSPNVMATDEKKDATVTTNNVWTTDELNDDTIANVTTPDLTRTHEVTPYRTVLTTANDTTTRTMKDVARNNVRTTDVTTTDEQASYSTTTNVANDITPLNATTNIVTNDVLATVGTRNRNVVKTPNVTRTYEVTPDSTAVLRTTNDTTTRELASTVTPTNVANDVMPNNATADVATHFVRETVDTATLTATDVSSRGVLNDVTTTYAKSIDVIKTGDVSNSISARGSPPDRLESGSDYISRGIANSYRVVFRAGVTMATCDGKFQANGILQLVDGSIIEATELFEVKLPAPSYGARLEPISNATSRILIVGPNDDYNTVLISGTTILMSFSPWTISRWTKWQWVAAFNNETRHRLLYELYCMQSGDVSNSISVICSAVPLAARGSPQDRLESGSDYISRGNTNSCRVVSSVAMPTCDVKFQSNGILQLVDYGIIDVKLSAPSNGSRLGPISNATSRVLIVGPNDDRNIYSQAEIFYSNTNQQQKFWIYDKCGEPPRFLTRGKGKEYKRILVGRCKYPYVKLPFIYVCLSNRIAIYQAELWVISRSKRGIVQERLTNIKYNWSFDATSVFHSFDSELNAASILVLHQLWVSVQKIKDSRTNGKSPRMYEYNPQIFRDALREIGIVDVTEIGRDEDLLRYELHFPSGCRMVVSVPMNIPSNYSEKSKEMEKEYK